MESVRDWLRDERLRDQAQRKYVWYKGGTDVRCF